MQKLAIYGAGYVGIQYAERWRRGEYDNSTNSRFVGFVDDRKEGSVNGIPILGKLEDLASLRTNRIDLLVVTLFGDPRKRLEIFLEAEQLGFSFPSICKKQEYMLVGKGVYVHETAVMLGAGRVLSDFSVVSALATIEGGVNVGRGVVLGPYVFVGAGSNIGEATVFRPRSSCLPHTNVGKNCTIGPNVVVHRDLPDGQKNLR